MVIMSSLPRIATCPLTDNFLTTRNLEIIYDIANDPRYGSTVSKCLFSQLFDEYFNCASLSAWGRQPVDHTRRSVTLTVGYCHDGPPLNLAYVLLVQAKKHKLKSQKELDKQLIDYGKRYLDTKGGGRAMNSVVYGAVTYRAKIRFFKFSWENDGFKSAAISAGDDAPPPETYLDVKADGRFVMRIMKDIWLFRQGLGSATTAA